MPEVIRRATGADLPSLVDLVARNVRADPMFESELHRVAWLDYQVKRPARCVAFGEMHVFELDGRILAAHGYIPDYSMDCVFFQCWVRDPDVNIRGVATEAAEANMRSARDLGHRRWMVRVAPHMVNHFERYDWLRGDPWPWEPVSGVRFDLLEMHKDA